MSHEHDGSKPDLERALARYLVEQRMTRRQLLARVAAVGATVALAPIIAACGTSAASASAASPSATAPPAPSASAAEATATPQPTPQPTPEGELFVYNWDAYIGQDTQQKFEDKYKVKVTYDKFPDEDTQITKIRSDGKGGGYDITYPASTEIPGLVSGGIIAELDQGLIPNAKNLGPEWANPGYDKGNAHSMPYMWWTTGFAWDGDKIKDDLTDWTALWDERFKGHMAMLDDVRECFAVGGFRLNLSPNTVAEADLDAILALLEQQKPLLRTYTANDIQDLTSGQVWITHAWSGDYFQMLADKPKTKYVVPSEGAVRGSDTMVVLSGAQHPVAANLWIDFNLDAKVSADNSNFMGYMGPNAAALPLIDPTISGDPRLNPDKATLDKLVELLEVGTDIDKYTTALEPAQGVTAAAADTIRRPFRERLPGLIFVGPGVAWLGLFFLFPLLIIVVVSLGTKDAAGNVDLSHPGLQNYIQATRPEYLPAFLNSLRYAAITTVLSILIGYPIAYWISRYGGHAEDPPAHPGDAPVLDELSHPDLRLDDHPARQRRAEFDARGGRGHQRSDPVPQHRLLGGPGDDLRVPAVRHPAAVRIDRPDGPEPGPGRPRPVRQRPPGLPPRDASDHDARDRRGRAADVYSRHR